MERKRFSKAIVFLLLSVVVMLPGRNARAAATDSIQKEIQYETTKKDDHRDSDFPEKMEQDGNVYIRKQITFKTLQEKPVQEKTPVYLEKKSSVIKPDEQYAPPEEIKEDGITYQLMQTTKEKKAIQKGYSQKVTGYSEYSSQAAANRAPDTKNITVQDPQNGESVTVTCQKKNVTKTSPTWEDTYIDIVFVTYDASHFVWNEVVVEKNTKTPLKGYETELLKSVGGNTKTYRIKNIQWNGESYRNKNGILCRRARAAVQKRTSHWRVNYAAIRKVKTVKGTVYRSTYVGTKDTNTGDTNYLIFAQAVYEKEKSQLPVAAITIGILAVLLVVVGILFLLRKKKKKE